MAAGELGLGPEFQQVHPAGIPTPQLGVPARRNQRHVSGLRISGRVAEPEPYRYGTETYCLSGTRTVINYGSVTVIKWNQNFFETAFYGLDMNPETEPES